MPAPNPSHLDQHNIPMIAAAGLFATLQRVAMGGPIPAAITVIGAGVGGLGAAAIGAGMGGAEDADDGAVE
ncbi:hypothetical protein EDB87DRAFT_1685407 [Lactarius vividus]|nr:hypothetical protein EDB87DRAFT_1685407 [Lactarius vividus]